MSDQIGVHSEMDAIIKLGNTDCSGLILINTRINRNNKFDMSKPCSGCLNMIRSLNFKKIYYINKSGLFESI
ncbi:MAG: hypothetical protein EBX50_09825 [Chitinophagia bacterium]|nr:hypothetical protein [Chitinophagia bacterium]